MIEKGKIILPHGSYQKLIAYQKSEIIYQGTYMFCQRFLCSYKDRTVDQMVQAARSCKQNIAEGSAASGTSKETEIKLTNVARATLDELIEDYRDYLKAHNCKEWDISDRRKIAARDFSAKNNHWEAWSALFSTRSAETLCNLMIIIIYQTRFLLDKMILSQERDFLRNGGIRERMSNARRISRIANSNDGSKLEEKIFSQLVPARNAFELSQMADNVHRLVEQIRKSIEKDRNW